MKLWCQECLLLADDSAKAWRLVRVDVPEEDDEPILADEKGVVFRFARIPEPDDQQRRLVRSERELVASLVGRGTQERAASGRTAP
jgi:hypothetical protein